MKEALKILLLVVMVGLLVMPVMAQNGQGRGPDKDKPGGGGGNGGGGNGGDKVVNVLTYQDTGIPCEISLLALGIPESLTTNIFTPNWTETEYRKSGFVLECNGYLPSIAITPDGEVIYPMRDYKPESAFTVDYAPGCTFSDGSMGVQMITYYPNGDVSLYCSSQ